MLRLNLWDDAGTSQYNVDLYDHEPVNLNYQFSDVTEINKSVGSYSHTFRIPATKTNTDFFGAIFNPNIYTASTGLLNGNYDIKKKIRGELLYNSLPLMKGYIQLKAVYVQKKDFADIEVVFFSDVADLSKEIGNSLLSDLDTSGIDHELNISNIQSSYVGTLFSGSVRYGAMDKGRNWTFADLENPPWDVDNGIYQSDLTPFVRAKWIIDQIFSEAGYTYDSSLFDTLDFGNIYLPAYNGAISPRSDNKEPDVQTCLATLDADSSMDSGSWTTLIITDTGGYDYGSNFNNLSHRYTAPYNALYTIKTTMTKDDDQTTYPAGIDIAVFKNGVLSVYFEGHQGSSFTETLTMDLNTSDYLELKWKTRGTGFGKILGDGTEGETSMHITSVSEPVTGQDIDMSSNFPVVKQMDFLMGLQKMFNLVFVHDKHTPKHLLIEPYRDYLATGTQKDWTEKIDYSKDVVIKPTADLQSKLYDWTHSEGQDFINQAIQDSTGRTYGRYRVTDPENDFATGEKEIKSPFAPYLVSYIPNSLFSIHRCIDKDGKGVKTPKPRLAYWNGLTTSLPPWYLKDDSGVTLASSGFFPHFSNYNEVVAGVTDNDLNFGYERAFTTIDAHPLNTLFYLYWMSYVNELYSNEARIFTAYIKLTRADIQDFEFSDKIYIKDSYYRILKISNFDATQGGSVQVELIKVLADIRDCADIPTGQKSISGAITFNNDSFDYGSKTCCERYGYIWYPRISRCYPASMEIQPS